VSDPEEETALADTMPFCFDSNEPGVGDRRVSAGEGSTGRYDCVSAAIVYPAKLAKYESGSDGAGEWCRLSNCRGL
jgi:hypothetical protein